MYELWTSYKLNQTYETVYGCQSWNMDHQIFTEMFVMFVCLFLFSGEDYSGRHKWFQKLNYVVDKVSTNVDYMEKYS